ncbi:ABC transporter ATP-binding protein [Methanocalculus taiwanensis]|uniref:Nickel import system ATP-binding protein NikD n=2 Tax=Methanocalculus taiwanensis TaxID=106207 RepID=A0ABD4TED3_9EURY|nr:ABC transporter ATP-binding protein [Methanocalculus taiwanensis]
MALIEIKNLNVHFYSRNDIVKANNGVDLSIGENEIVGLIGETGCGKTILGRAIMRLLSPNVSLEGSILYLGRNILDLTQQEIQAIRGREIGMILQNPAASLNPVLPVGEQVAEVFRCHLGNSVAEAEQKAKGLFEQVGIDPARMKEYPHQFSGGMKQRVMIAIGLAATPKLLIADEPTKGLDKERKWQIITLMSDLIRKRSVSMLLITHDLEIAEAICDRIAVMYAGEIIEIGRTADIMQRTLHSTTHPYANALIHALPKYGMMPIPGEIPSLSSLPSGCRFHPRCAERREDCSQVHPEMREIQDNHLVRCLYRGVSNEHP